MANDEINDDSIGKLIEKRKQENEAFIKLLREVDSRKSVAVQAEFKKKKQ